MISKWLCLIVSFLAASIVQCGKEETPEVKNTEKQVPVITNPPAKKSGVVAPGAELLKLAGGFGFTEGPVRDAEGNVYFTDDTNGKVYRWSTDGSLSTYLDSLKNPAGLAIDRKGRLLICEKGNHRVIAVESNKKKVVLAHMYNGKLLNQPNDLWVDLKGGIYFSDPYYGPKDQMPQDGKHVYYITPDQKQVIRVTHDVVHPNGVIGTPDGKLLYVADNRGEVKTWVFDINDDGSLANKRLHADQGADGVTLDTDGNIYLTMDKIYVYNTKGVLIDEIDTPEPPHNLCFFGEDNRTLFITAEKSIYSIRLRTQGMY